MAITWVEQVDTGGCGIACLAMLMDTTYARIRELFPEFCNHCGVHYENMFEILAQEGYAIRKIDRVAATNYKIRSPWPVKPFADKHLVLVYQTRQDCLVGVGNSHYVVMDRKGVVYDPAIPEFEKRRLKNYHRVEWIAGVYQV